MESRPIFLTGGTGLLGNTILRSLLERGHSVRVLSRSGVNEAFGGLDVEVVRGDLSDAECLEKAITGCQAVIHSAAHIHIGWSQLSASRDVNVEGTRKIADSCHRQSARLVYISTVDTLPAARSLDDLIDESGEDGVAKTLCSYVVSKTEAEAVVRQMHRESNLDVVIIHPGFMLGPYDWKPSSGRMMLEVTKAPFPIAPPGGCSLCDSRDVAEAVVEALVAGRSGRNYILAGENLTYQELWQQMLDTAGRKKRVRRMGTSIRWAGKAIDLALRVLPLREGDVNGAAIEMGCLNHFYDSSRASEELGYSRRATHETLADAWQWLESRFR